MSDVLARADLIMLPSDFVIFDMEVATGNSSSKLDRKNKLIISCKLSKAIE